MRPGNFHPLGLLGRVGLVVAKSVSVLSVDWCDLDLDLDLE